MPGGLGEQVGVDEGIEIAVEHALRVPDLEARPLVLDLLVRVQDVAADPPPAEADVLDIAALLRQLGFPLLLGQLGEPRLEDPHRRLLVRRLRALVLALRDDPRRQVRDADRGIGLVHVLAAGALRAIRVDAQIALVDLELGVVESSGDTITPANDVWRRCAWSNGDCRTSRCGPRSVLRIP